MVDELRFAVYPFDLRDPMTGKSICAREMIADREATIISTERRAESAERRAESAEREARELRRRLELLEGRGE